MSSIMYEIKVSDPSQTGMLPPNLANCDWVQNFRKSIGLNKVWFVPNPYDYPDHHTYTIFCQFPDVETMNNWINTWRMDETFRRDYELWVNAQNIVITEKYFIFDDSEENKTTIQAGQGIWS